MKKEAKPELAWAWLCDFGLCLWAAPTRKQLVSDGKPSPEAVPVRVRISVIPKRTKRETQS